MAPKNDLESLYKPSRFSLKESRTFFQELIGGLVSYLKKKLHHPQALQLSTIERGQGKIIEIANEKYGAYRDETNKLHIVAAECTI
jgi:hypothetical protein